MANITRIKAKDSREKHKKSPEEASPEPKKPAEKATKVTAVSDTAKDKKSAKMAKKAEKLSKKEAKQAHKKPMSAPVRFITWPFRYIHESWLELRQVRWPSRKAAWKMVLAVLVYTALFIAIIMLLDALFTLIFNQLLS